MFQAGKHWHRRSKFDFNTAALHISPWFQGSRSSATCVERYSAPLSLPPKTRAETNEHELAFIALHDCGMLTEVTAPALTQCVPVNVISTSHRAFNPGRPFWHDLLDHCRGRLVPSGTFFERCSRVLDFHQHAAVSYWLRPPI